MDFIFEGFFEFINAFFGKKIDTIKTQPRKRMLSGLF